MNQCEKQKYNRIGSCWFVDTGCVEWMGEVGAKTHNLHIYFKQKNI